MVMKQQQNDSIPINPWRCIHVLDKIEGRHLSFTSNTELSVFSLGEGYRQQSLHLNKSLCSNSKTKIRIYSFYDNIDIIHSQSTFSLLVTSLFSNDLQANENFSTSQQQT